MTPDILTHEKSRFGNLFYWWFLASTDERDLLFRFRLILHTLHLRIKRKRKNKCLSPSTIIIPRLYYNPKDLFTLYDCECNFSYRSKWIVQDSMEVFTLYKVTISQTPIQSTVSKNKSQWRILTPDVNPYISQVCMCHVLLYRGLKNDTNFTAQRVNLVHTYRHRNSTRFNI